ncbi:type I-C CRISPR-associated protein Cas5c [Legionella pneumophila serogroup 1]|uniref:type I-C CRISPR-associated protein Cas5c n=1 Tax=Legionella pneumophila TaxID=446 RepID=UPI00048981AB|nr:type I-C CRISPR-associated protein Cas5c [Legionella pneumophila]MCZ4738009.1 type I-C CRISPR-associated protein Cas5c [Legionella pneumophila]MDF1929799.1 type I-C CRISPR-associated protein Cas5c [Legionella pneumophila]MDI9828207.1 type I-C CRISPR-associated protein Cas5c [Legionella pneumophila]MDO5158291.1 type I-C CRISPR-associated protein Cas5c [Legionella pneumophila]MDO5163254.1 type I-C CRISPR-associated protein Cas5c [Legionella pneumophila]
MPNNYCLEVRSAFACFTRPEMKVERVSYDVITPSAARAIFEAIFWKPAISWRVTRIDVLNPIRWISIRRNEVGTVMSSRSNGIYIEDARQQRASLLLRDVRYRIYADLSFDQSKDVSSQYGKYTSMFERRAEKGQCFNQPYLGCREFSCDYRLVTNLLNEPSPIAEDRSLGWMLYDMDYHDPKNPTPRFFNAQMNAGVLQVPAWDSEEVKG